jgi:hypothetical protein
MPADDTVHDRIMANVIASLATIVAGASFYTTVSRVHEMKGNAFACLEMPAVIVSHLGCDEKYGAIDQVECNLKLAVSLVMKHDESGNWQRDIRRFAEDAKKLLRTDFGRGTFAGNANAFDTYIEGVEVANENDGFPVALAQINVRIQFRHNLDDPTVAT